MILKMEYEQVKIQVLRPPSRTLHVPIQIQQDLKPQKFLIDPELVLHRYMRTWWDLKGYKKCHDQPLDEKVAYSVKQRIEYYEEVNPLVQEILLLQAL